MTKKYRVEVIPTNDVSTFSKNKNDIMFCLFDERPFSKIEYVKINLINTITNKIYKSDKLDGIIHQFVRKAGYIIEVISEKNISIFDENGKFIINTKKMSPVIKKIKMR